MKSLTQKPLGAFRAFSLLLLSIIGFFYSPIPASAVSGDQHWDVKFGAPGVGTTVDAITFNNGNLIAGGVGNPSTNAPLSSWDGNQWTVIGVFNSSSTTIIEDAASAGGYLYVAGIFTSVNGVTVNGLARWDGTSWSSVGGFSGSALGLLASGSDLYVAGGFTNADISGVVMTNIGHWDGGAWHALGNGLGTLASGYVRALAMQGTTLYAGGSFTNSGGAPVTNLAVWNGSAWAQVGGTCNGAIDGLALNGGSIYATGSFSQAGTTPASYVAQWDGSTWHNLSTGLSGLPGSIAAYNNQIYVSGSFVTAGGVTVSNFAIWNGSTWSAAGRGLSSSANRVIATSTNVFVGGNFGLAGNAYANGIAGWDGTNWTALGTAGRTNGLPSNPLAFASDGTNLYAGGFLVYAGGNVVNYISKFDGTNWQPLGSGVGPIGSIIRSLAWGNNNLYVGGVFSTAGGVSAQNIARWDGTNWYAMGVGPGGVVATIVVRPEGVYAGGAVINGNNYGAPIFSRWDGTNWNPVVNYNTNNSLVQIPLADPDITLDAAVFLGTNIFLGGDTSLTQYDPAVGFNPATNCHGIMRFDGTYAEIVGSGLGSNVVSMAAIGNILYVAGNFTTAGGNAANHIAQWDGTNWSAVGGSVVGSGNVYSLTTIGTNLYAVGGFTNMGGVLATNIAKWNGTSWSALGTGTVLTPGASSGNVVVADGIGNDLYVGGAFRYIGNKMSYQIGHWNDQVNYSTPQLLNPTSPANSQFRVRLEGVAGLTNSIQAGSDLSSWSNVLSTTNAIYDFTDTVGGTNTRRFYRAATQE